jgi:hypothetical protein
MIIDIILLIAVIFGAGLAGYLLYSVLHEDDE